MANNRMYLSNKRTGQQVLVAKFYPSTGWTAFHRDLADKLNEAFHPSLASPHEWALEYDEEPDTAQPEPEQHDFEPQRELEQHELAHLRALEQAVRAGWEEVIQGVLTTLDRFRQRRTPVSPTREK